MPKINPDELLRAVGRRIAEVRRSRGWTQAVFAERLGMSERYVQAVEAGKENVSVRSLATFGDALDVRVGELFRKPRTNLAKPLPPTKRRSSRTR